ncbi:MAG: Oligopeptide/dipeptide transporter, ATP-binding protein C-terminal protein [Amycolatopsis sp.]|uniref:ABC transporter ATP-binding protein n=1 Tax=Amycolatopsis sp. TaxID=37632 RepID=UPI0026219A0D|nr:ABC transporter ATP-binding protein [Amycolatopsis sp.]MCU1680624.1 Oligopeptide/dipeptide transporter, ATP-binding protein C-terminal protein [Amycolatopsis sp.]
MNAPLLDVSGLTLDLPGAHGYVPILTGLDLQVRPGEAVGIVGESGSGKSMTLRCIARLAPEGARIGGSITVGGRDVSTLKRSALRDYRRRETAVIFQDPRSAINPIQRVGDFLIETARDAGADVPAARRAAVDMLSRMGIVDPERRMGQFPFELSGGLLQRVMIASVLLSGPSLILADEPTTALDVTTQSDVLAISEELRRDSGTALVFVTHDLDLALSICDRVVVLYAGTVLELADAETIRHAPAHPYTRGLLASRPPLDERLAELPVIDGAPISAADAGGGCPFLERCPSRIPLCEKTKPKLQAFRGGQVRCHRAEELATVGSAS